MGLLLGNQKSRGCQDPEEDAAHLGEGKFGRREVSYMSYCNCTNSDTLKMNHSSVGGYDAKLSQDH